MTHEALREATKRKSHKLELIGGPKKVFHRGRIISVTTYQFQSEKPRLRAFCQVSGPSVRNDECTKGPNYLQHIHFQPQIGNK